MIEYLTGQIQELTPTYLVVEVGQIGYFVNISLATFEQLQGKKQAKIYVHQIIREDSFSLYGFYTRDERNMFRLLISVSGVGASTARLMLSSLKPDELRQAISMGDVQLLKSIKGIGTKTAQRIIVDLKDKIDKGSEAQLDLGSVGQISQEAVEALVTLGFSRKTVEKVVSRILKQNPDFSVEQVIKASFKFLT